MIYGILQFSCTIAILPLIAPTKQIINALPEYDTLLKIRSRTESKQYVPFVNDTVPIHLIPEFEAFVTFWTKYKNVTICSKSLIMKFEIDKAVRFEIVKAFRYVARDFLEHNHVKQEHAVFQEIIGILKTVTKLEQKINSAYYFAVMGMFVLIVCCIL
jgi:hypothetical protein